jgi:hypothetical protein
MEVFNTLTRLYTGGYKEANIRNFIEAVDKIRYGDYISKKTSSGLK